MNLLDNLKYSKYIAIKTLIKYINKLNTLTLVYDTVIK
jgi:hypothetical protein